jgi:hypothetical protein
MAGKLCLIKLVLSSLSLYYMFVFPIPKGISNVISSINRFFGVERYFKFAWYLQGGLA